MSQIMTVFIIATLGYILGNIKIVGLKFGSSGIILVALVFGHFGFGIPDVIKELGLAFFVGSVGFIAGPVFFRGFKKQAGYYFVIATLIIGTGTLTTIAAIHLLKLPTALGLGIMCGALTSTPGLGSAIEATGSNLASVGYGVAYPFGVVGSVLFVQMVPILGKYDTKEESRKLTEKYANANNMPECEKAFKTLNNSEFLVFSAAMVIGFIIANTTIPLPGGISFGLGVAGGPLLAGLIFGHVGHIGDISITIPKKNLEIFRELGLMLFLMGAGTGAGKGFVSVVSEYGVKLFIMGAVITLMAISVGFFAANKMFKLSLFDSLGCVCGGKTSTPSLGALINVAQNDNVIASYAATYPISLICVVLVCRFIAIVLG